MRLSLREKANSFDRILRQKSANYLKECEKISLRLMELSYEIESKPLQKRIDRLRNAVTQVRNDIEYGSFIALPAFRSAKRSKIETQNLMDQEIIKLLSVSELLLLQSRELFDSLQGIQSTFYDSNEQAITRSFATVEQTLQQIEALQRSRQSLKDESLEKILLGYSETVIALEDLAKKEDVYALEAKHLEGMMMDKGTIIQRAMSNIRRKPVFETEIRDTIIGISNRLRTQSGGLIRLAELFYLVKASNHAKNITISDVEKVAQNLADQGLIPGIREISGIKIVELAPVTATPDQNIILDFAAKTGKIEMEELLRNTKWTYERANRALKEMEQIGLAKYEITENSWVFPAFVNKVETAEE
jgi:hypothetical protein